MEYVVDPELFAGISQEFGFNSQDWIERKIQLEEQLLEIQFEKANPIRSNDWVSEDLEAFEIGLF